MNTNDLLQRLLEAMEPLTEHHIALRHESSTFRYVHADVLQNIAMLHDELAVAVAAGAKLEGKP